MTDAGDVRLDLLALCTEAKRLSRAQAESNKVQFAVAGPELWLRAPCLTKLRKSPGRTEFQRGVLTTGPDGQLAVESTGAQGSGILHSMSVADCFIRLPAESGDVEPGTMVDVQPFHGVV